VQDITPELLRRAGVRFVHQESTIVPGITVLENLAVGGYATRRGSIRWRHELERTRALLAEWDLQISPHADAGSLSSAELAKLGMLKAILVREGEEPVHAIVLDEPTAALGPDDAEELLTWLRTAARRRDVGVLFISHRIEEILGFADRVCVLRGGRIVADLATNDLSHDVLVSHIVGRALDSYYPDRAAQPGAVRLRVDGATGGRVRDLSFVVHAGETIGITGRPDSGFDDVPLLLVDPRAAVAGSISVDGTTVPLPHTPIPRRADLGIALVPDERKRRALAGELSVRENIALPRLRAFRRGLAHRLRAERSDAGSRPPLRHSAGHVDSCREPLVRRKPAEGGACEVAQHGTGGADRARADPGGGRGCQGRDLPRARRHRGGSGRRRHRERRAGGPGAPVRPGAGAARGDRLRRAAGRADLSADRIAAATLGAAA
jgi:ribose transport system ATP-binding protein